MEKKKRGGKRKRPRKKAKRKAKKPKKKPKEVIAKTSIQIGTDTRDRLYKLKFRKSYDLFLKELCDLFEREFSE